MFIVGSGRRSSSVQCNKFYDFTRHVRPPQNTRTAARTLHSISSTHSARQSSRTSIVKHVRGSSVVTAHAHTSTRHALCLSRLESAMDPTVETADARPLIPDHSPPHAHVTRTPHGAPPLSLIHSSHKPLALHSGTERSGRSASTVLHSTAGKPRNVAAATTHPPRASRHPPRPLTGEASRLGALASPTHPITDNHMHPPAREPLQSKKRPRTPEPLRTLARGRHPTSQE